MKHVKRKELTVKYLDPNVKVFPRNVVVTVNFNYVVWGANGSRDPVHYTFVGVCAFQAIAVLPARTPKVRFRRALADVPAGCTICKYQFRYEKE